MILKSVTESNFRKSSGFYINSGEGVCNESAFSKASGLRELIAEFVLISRLWSGSFIKFQAFTINSSEGFCDRVCNGICI